MSRDPSARCPTCSSEELLTVTMDAHGDRISFTLCNACGWKRWGRGNEQVLLSSVRPLLMKRLPDSETSEPTRPRASGRMAGGTDQHMQKPSRRASRTVRPSRGARRKRSRRG